jgi:hypothetical protein
VFKFAYTNGNIQLDGARGILVVEAWHFKWLEFLFTFQDFGCLLFASTFVLESMQIYRAPPWNQTSISVVKSSQRSFCFANYQSSEWHDLPSKICHSPCIEKKELPFWESLSSLTIYPPSKIWKSSHTIYMILVLQIKLLFVLQQASCSEALHRQKIQPTHFTQNHYQKLLKHFIQVL